jgi:hypothetical protein
LENHYFGYNGAEPTSTVGFAKFSRNEAIDIRENMMQTPDADDRPVPFLDESILKIKINQA